MQNLVNKLKIGLTAFYLIDSFFGYFSGVIKLIALIVLAAQDTTNFWAEAEELGGFGGNLVVFLSEEIKYEKSEWAYVLSLNALNVTYAF